MVSCLRSTLEVNLLILLFIVQNLISNKALISPVHNGFSLDPPKMEMSDREAQIILILVVVACYTTDQAREIVWNLLQHCKYLIKININIYFFTFVVLS